MDSFEQYWIGKGIDLDGVWDDFDNGQGYIQKVDSSELHLLRLSFDTPQLRSPLFSHEAILKTIKGTFHDVKFECYSQQKYDEMAPIFLYRVNRGSGIYEFLAQIDPSITWVAALGGAAIAYRTMLAKDQEFDEKKLNFIKTNFPNASPEDTAAYVKAWTTFSRRRVLQRLLEQKLAKVEISESPVAMDIEADPKMIDMAMVAIFTNGEDVE